jgi:hypothetical protein
MDDRELRNIILLPVKACRLYQGRAVTANTSLTWLIGLPPNKRASLTAAQLQAYSQEIRPQIQKMADAEAKQAVEALEGEGDFVFPLQVYASKCHWK